jgi:hypothetical protein
MDGDEAGAGSFRRGARECGKTKKVIKPMIESSCPSAGIGFLNDIFYIDDPPFVNPSDNHMMQRPWAIRPRLS